MVAQTSISVRYKHVDGWHVFQCDEMPGLYVASRDRRVAYNDVAPAIEQLMKLDHNVDAKVVPQASYAEFLAAARSATPKPTKKAARAAPREESRPWLVLAGAFA